MELQTRSGAAALFIGVGLGLGYTELQYVFPCGGDLAIDSGPQQIQVIY